MFKRYMLFGFDRYYPSGGMDDFIDSFDTLPEIVEKIKKDSVDYCTKKDDYQIYDVVEMKEVSLELDSPL